MPDTSDTFPAADAPAPEPTELARTVLRKLKARLGNAWTARLKGPERALLEALAADAAGVALRAQVEGHAATKQAKREIDASFAHVQSMAASDMRKELYASVHEAVRDLIGLAIKVL